MRNGLHPSPIGVFVQENEKFSSSRKGALGKGISSLLGGAEDGLLDETPYSASLGSKADSVVILIDVEQIDPNPAQPRKIFDPKALAELAASLKQDGLLQPVIVAHGESAGRYILIAGERRWRASRLAGLKSIPAILKDGAREDMLRLALIENIQRADLNIMEEAEAYAALIKDLGLTQDQCADRVGKDRSTISNILRLLALPKEIRDDITNGRMSMGHGRAILGLEDRKSQLRCRDIVLKKELNVRQTEQLVKSFRLPSQGGKGGPIRPLGEAADIQYLTDSLRSHLHTKVRIAGSAARGRIEISYFSTSELERILKAMGHQP